MPQRPENFNPADEDPEVTLVTPRFDETEARRAHPVVPLAEVPARRAPRAPRRAWTPALLAVAVLAVAALGGAVATQVMLGPRAESTQEQTQPAPVQAAEAPPQTITPAAADVPREEAPAKPSARATRPRRARAATTATLAVPRRDEAEDYQEEAEELREIREEVRREREKEMRKASKRGKDKAPRLVDVLTRP